ncbi:hypothetical protein EDC01DRAFT_70607 [Geopyxis carbonaria]|nr:hypothetical protein EDC01DRAFT_70607 [Geopyxis carbonaria]
MAEQVDILHTSSSALEQVLPEAGLVAAPTESNDVPSDQMMADNNDIGNHSSDNTQAAAGTEPGHQSAKESDDIAQISEVAESAGATDEATEVQQDADMSDQHEYSEDESEYEPEPDSPPPKSKTPKTPNNRSPKTPKNTRPPKTPISRVRTGRVEKSSSPAAHTTLRCPVKGCGQTFTGRNPRQSLWHHLKYYATRGLKDKAEFEKLHGEAHSEMKRDAEPKGTPVERNRISSSDYRKKNPEKAKTSARLSNFRARARKKGITDDREVEEAVARWEKEWQEKQAKEASEYFSGILLSAFE